jgi:DNA polymerase III, delta subunit
MSTHHAVLISVPQPLSFAGEESLQIPLHMQIRIPQFAIADARSLITAAFRRPEGGNLTQTLLVATEFITEEAQQALLKIIEEPPLSTQFIFVLPEGYALLPTLESRFSRQSESSTAQSVTAVFEDFITVSVSERLLMVEQRLKAKDQVWQSDIKRGLAGYLVLHRSQLTNAVYKELEYVLRLLLTRGASNKFLLEHLALSLPLKTG